MGSSSALITCHNCGQTATYWYGNTVECSDCCPSWRCQLQSEEYLLAPPPEEMAQTSEQTTGFMDGSVGNQVGTGATHTEYDLADAVTDAGLAEFLSRPVRIQTVTWNLSDPRGLLALVDPWRVFFDNASIKNKLNNFAFLRCNLKLKFLVNASPFYYGSVRACYQPLLNFKPTTIATGTQSGETTPELIPYSQPPGVS